MKALKLLISTVSIFLITFQYCVAQACIYEINEKQKTEELKNVALADILNENIYSANVLNFSFHESKQLTMCPDELTFETNLNVAFKNGSLKCIADIKVIKVESWISDISTYTVTRKKTCTP